MKTTLAASLASSAGIADSIARTPAITSTLNEFVQPSSPRPTAALVLWTMMSTPPRASTASLTNAFTLSPSAMSAAAA